MAPGAYSRRLLPTLYSGNSGGWPCSGCCSRTCHCHSRVCFYTHRVGRFGGDRLSASGGTPWACLRPNAVGQTGLVPKVSLIFQRLHCQQSAHLALSPGFIEVSGPHLGLVEDLEALQRQGRPGGSMETAIVIHARRKIPKVCAIQTNLRATNCLMPLVISMLRDYPS